MSITGNWKYKLKNTKTINITYVPTRHEHWKHVSSRKPLDRSMCRQTHVNSLVKKMSLSAVS